MLSDATFYDCINPIYQFIKLFLERQMSIFEEYGVFKYKISFNLSDPDQTECLHFKGQVLTLSTLCEI